jgi:thiol-disulfide isomerase/thioredoxin
MNRRQVVAGAGGLALTGGAAWLAFGRESTSDFAVTVDTLNAPGSEAGTQRLPVPGTVTLLDLFATWCAPCKAQMRSLRPVHDAYADDVAFVSVTNEQFGGGLTRADVAGWWEQHDGNWTLGHDPASVVHQQVSASGLPYLVLTDAQGQIVWSHAGVASETRLREEIDSALAGES